MRSNESYPRCDLCSNPARALIRLSGIPADQCPRSCLVCTGALWSKVCDAEAASLTARLTPMGDTERVLALDAAWTARPQLEVIA